MQFALKSKKQSLQNSSANTDIKQTLETYPVYPISIIVLTNDTQMKYSNPIQPFILDFLITVSIYSHTDKTDNHRKQYPYYFCELLVVSALAVDYCMTTPLQRCNNPYD